jgi:hypothetical protein
MAATIRDRRSAAALSALLLAGVLWPIRQNWRAEPRDGFPFSYYPMFSFKRSKRYSTHYLVGLTDGGERVVIPYWHAGSGGLNQVRRQLRQIALRGDGNELCAAVAARLASSADPRFAAVTSVRLVNGQYRLADYFRGARDPIREQIRGSFEIAGDGR